MKKWMLVAAALVVVALAGGYYGATARAGAKLQGCEDWVDQTNARVQDARSLLYPADRPDAFQGDAQQAAQELFAIFEEQANSDPPDAAGQLNGDLIEAMSVGAEGLAGTGAAAPETQIVFAKSIIYNADVRLLSVIDTC